MRFYMIDYLYCYKNLNPFFLLESLITYPVTLVLSDCRHLNYTSTCM